MMNINDITQVAVIINTHGVKGEVKISPLTDNPEIFRQLERLVILEENKPRFYSVIGARPFKKYYWLIKLDEIRDIDSAQKLKGKAIYLKDEELKPLAEDEFFIHDLLNAKVYSVDNRYLGVITDYFEAGAQGVCEVSDGVETFLIPMTDEVIKEIVPSEKVVIQLLPDLMELNR